MEIIAGICVVISFVLGSIWGKGITVKHTNFDEEDVPNQYNDTSQYMPENVKNYYDLKEGDMNNGGD